MKKEGLALCVVHPREPMCDQQSCAQTEDTTTPACAQDKAAVAHLHHNRGQRERGLVVEHDELPLVHDLRVG